MTSQSHIKENGQINHSTVARNRNAIEPLVNVNFEDEAKQRADLVEWLNGMLPDLRLPLEASEEEIRASLRDGAVLCSVLDRLRPGSVIEWGGSDHSSEPRVENVKRFLATMDQMRLPRFSLLDLEQGSMVTVVDCLLTLKEHFNSNPGGNGVHITSSMGKCGNQSRKGWKLLEAEISEGINGSVGEVSPGGQDAAVTGEEKRKNWTDSKFQRALRSPVMSEPSAALIHHVGHKFHEVFQLKQGRYADIPAAKISEMMKSNSFDNAPTQSLLSVVNGILDESIERKNGEIPHRVACLLRKVVQEIERRISTQAEHLRTQNNLYKAREEKYQSRLRVLETLATGTSEETQVAMNKFQQIKVEKTKVAEKKKLEEQDMVRLMKEKDHIDIEISTLKQDLELSIQKYEQRCLQLETQAKGTKVGLEERLKELEGLLEGSRKKFEELESLSELKSQSWIAKEHSYQTSVDFQFKSLQELRITSQSIKKVVQNTQRIYSEEFSQLGVKLKGLAEVAENYHIVLAENRKLYNEVQDLKGNIRVYCRIRPFLPGQKGKQTTIDFIGENGELIIVNPLKQGKDSRRLFKFNKVFGPTATQGFHLLTSKF
ncbi:kinesin-like protein KIN-14K [Macadamia integrifolia]|uniref:kinesin-like protein KIN-14K n=1 Tax=Macadamia integrifolia TaxID=60698 RepID=UPI001C4EFAD7|nr:kinesin-like protein KIN-14K [Macadamia integrifolia]XP_042496778.1 kinesin-like protein KIN-14K [Macadamia integrifolia]